VTAATSSVDMVLEEGIMTKPNQEENGNSDKKRPTNQFGNL
jgi:hypothetical protein